MKNNNDEYLTFAEAERILNEANKKLIEENNKLKEEIKLLKQNRNKRHSTPNFGTNHSKSYVLTKYLREEIANKLNLATLPKKHPVYKAVKEFLIKQGYSIRYIHIKDHGLHSAIITDKNSYLHIISDIYYIIYTIKSFGLEKTCRKLNIKLKTYQEVY